MAEQRTNGLGQVVEYNEKTGRWVPVKEDAVAEPAPAEAPVEAPPAEGNDPVPAEGEDEDTTVYPTRRRRKETE